jgi:hypothetical protein
LRTPKKEKEREKINEGEEEKETEYMNYVRRENSFLGTRPNPWIGSMSTRQLYPYFDNC